MPLIQISQVSDQTPEQKRDLVSAVTEAYCAATGTNREKVWVIVRQIQREDWAIGGSPLSDRT